jgi:hypothetical protein
MQANPIKHAGDIAHLWLGEAEVTEDLRIEFARRRARLTTSRRSDPGDHLATIMLAAGSHDEAIALEAIDGTRHGCGVHL